jgi:hypothetical protein
VRSNTAPGVVPLPIYRCGGEGPRALRPVGCVGGSDQEDRDIGCAAEIARATPGKCRRPGRGGGYRLFSGGRSHLPSGVV